MNVALYKYAGNDDMFLESIHKAIMINPDDPFTYNSLASFYYKKNQQEKAIENYEKFFDLTNRYGGGMYQEFVDGARDRLLEMGETVNW